MTAFTRRLSPIGASLQTLASKSWFLYGTLALLQFKLFWNSWLYRDLTTGDTSSYYVDASRWFQNFQTSLGFSPLYSVFYGSLRFIWRDPYAVTLVHRILIALIASLLVLAVLRRLLPSPLAWLLAAWWVVLPVNYDSLYEVHQFAVIVPLIAYLVAASHPTMLARGVVLGLLLLTTLLVRNEFVLVLLPWALVCLVYEIRQRRQGIIRRLGAYAFGYGLPLLAAVGIIVLFYVQASLKFPKLSEILEAKHTVNVCQIYAFNYQQRYDDWKGDVWTGCSDLMQRDFGQPYPSLFQAIEANPRAMLDYFLWNARLIPDGVQVLLFNATAGVGQPDYVQVDTGESYALVLSLLVLAILLAGGAMLWRSRRYWWTQWIKTPVWGWLALILTLPAMPVVMLIQRPRPEYLYPMSVFIMAAVGLGVAALLWRTPARHVVTLLLPVVIVALLILVPSRFTPDYRVPTGAPGRPLYTAVERLLPYQAIMAQPNTGFLSRGYGTEICNYVAGQTCHPLDVVTYQQQSAIPDFSDWLDDQGITVIYFTADVLGDPRIRTFVETVDPSKWKRVVLVNDDPNSWLLLERVAEQS